jgi:hypothetical protein
MDKELEFKFNMLSKKQLLKLASAYSVKIQGAMPNSKTSDEDLLNAIESQLTVLPDGSIERIDKKESYNEVKITGGSRVRIIIL